jgi:hypothetical protein
MKGKLYLLAACVLIALTLMQASCGKSRTTSTKSSNLSTTSPSKSSTTSNPSGVLAKSSDGSVSLFVPNYFDPDNSLWHGANVAGSKMLIAGSTSLYDIVVLEKPKSSYAAGLTADDFLTGEHSVFYWVHNMTWKQSSNITIGGLSGVTVQLNGQNIGNSEWDVYLISVVADNNNFYEIIGWANTNMNGVNLQDLQNIMNTFKVY